MIANLNLVLKRKTCLNQWWSLIKQVQLSNSSSEGIPPLEDNDQILTDDKDKANAFNIFYLDASTIDYLWKPCSLPHPDL